jgi:hypothetical protein
VRSLAPPPPTLGRVSLDFGLLSALLAAHEWSVGDNGRTGRTVLRRRHAFIPRGGRFPTAPHGKSQGVSTTPEPTFPPTQPEPTFPPTPPEPTFPPEPGPDPEPPKPDPLPEPPRPDPRS